MNSPATISTLTLTQENVIRTLLYFDIFHYPLKLGEIFKFLRSNHIDESGLRKETDKLVQAGLLFQFGEYYSIKNSDENIVRRVKGNRMAEEHVPLAHRQAKRIAGFPFVRGVMASGSLSKGYMDESSDLDFFIVAEQKRLWIARMLLVIYKRIFLGNSHKYFCVNYFVDTHHLEIEDKNIFTATELATLMPLWNHVQYHKLIACNPWLYGFFPNLVLNTTVDSAYKNSSLKNFLETLINTLGGNWIDRQCMRLTQRRWLRLYGNAYSKEDHEIAFKSKRHVSKNHPRHFQRKVTEVLNEKLDVFAKQHAITWSHD